MKNSNVTTKDLKTNKEKTSTMRANATICNRIKLEVDTLNKMKKGSRKINNVDILERLLPLLNDEIRNSILASTVTSKDRHKVAFENFKKKNKQVKEDEFLDLIQYGEVYINDYLPEEMKRQKSQ